MTRKHFNAIAEDLKLNKPQSLHPADDHAAALRHDGMMEQWNYMVKSMASTVGQFNGNFDRQRFLNACGVK